jgi:hypothetical protein
VLYRSQRERVEVMESVTKLAENEIGVIAGNIALGINVQLCYEFLRAFGHGWDGLGAEKKP